MQDRTKRYAKIKYALAIIDVAYFLFLLALFQFSGMAISLRDNIAKISANRPILISLYSLSVFCIYTILDFPLVFYRSYVVEHRFNLSVEKFSNWFSDMLKSCVLSFLVFLILSEFFFNILKYYPSAWWWVAGIFWISLSIVIARIFPVLVIPLFFKYRTVQDEELRRRIFDLSDKMGIKILDVYEIDFSKKSAKANAALVGLGKSKRVILTDTLQGKFSHDEIEVILAHEFAHSKLKHLMKLVILNTASAFFMFYLFFKLADHIFTPLGISPDDIAGIGAWIFLFTGFQIFITPLTNWISRNMERNADIMAIKSSGKKETFVSMLEKLTEQNLSERKPGLLAKIFFYTHPPVEERLALVNKTG